MIDEDRWYRTSETFRIDLDEISNPSVGNVGLPRSLGSSQVLRPTEPRIRWPQWPQSRLKDTDLRDLRVWRLIQPPRWFRVLCINQCTHTYTHIYIIYTYIYYLIHIYICVFLSFNWVFSFLKALVTWTTKEVSFSAAISACEKGGNWPFALFLLTLGVK